MNSENRCPACHAELAANAPRGLCPACLLKGGLGTQTGETGGSKPSQEADFVPPTPAELARHFPDLEILELVGRGGMGVVYKARQKHLERLVALKILAPKVAGDPAFAERFVREARAMALLSHPHVVAVYDFGQTDGLYYFLMEFVDGVNVRRLLDTGKLEPKEALAIVPQICDALQYAHDHGVVHRDIKPENILMDRSGQVKIADFGIAKLVGRETQDLTLTGAGQIVGTPHYMAPEQIEHPLNVDHRADIYSLGVVFYQMLTGELPIGRFAPPSKKVQIDVRLDEVVLRALEKDPQLRFQQASEFKTEVETIAQAKAGESSGLVVPELLDWARQMGNRWLTPVGTRHGKRDINWPAAFFTSAAIAGAIFSLLFLPNSLQSLLGRSSGESPVQLFVTEFIAMALAAIAMTFFIRWKLKVPIEKLPVLDDPASRENTGGSGSVAFWIAMLIIPLLLFGGTFLMNSPSGNVAGNASLTWLPTLFSMGMILFAFLGFLFFIRSFVQIKTGKARMPMVGVQNGKRVVHWPGVAVRAAVIPVALGMVVCLAYFIGGHRSIESLIRQRPHELLSVVLCTLLLILLAMGVKFRLDWAKAVEDLSRLDASPPDEPLCRTSSGAQRALSGSRVAWFIVAYVVLMAMLFFLSNHAQQRSIDILERQNSLLQRQIGQGELQIEQRLRSLGLAWDNYGIELAPDSSRTIWHFVGLRKLKGSNGANDLTRIDGNLHVEVLRNGDWQVRGDGQLGHVQFTVAVPG